jgi:hypothetical protein
MGVHHVLMSLLNVIELLLLIRVEQRPDLQQRAVHHRFGFLHRLLMNGSDLRLRPIDERLHLCLLVRRQVQLLGYSLEAEAMSMSWPPAPGPGCACTTTKPPSAIAPAATSVNTFRFMIYVSVVVLLRVLALP